MVTLAVLAEGGRAESHIRKLREELTLKSFLVKATTCNRRRLNDAQSTTHDLTRRAPRDTSLSDGAYRRLIPGARARPLKFPCHGA
jgi:hypothetical protein